MESIRYIYHCLRFFKTFQAKKIRQIKNIQKLSEAWNLVTEEYNKITGKSATKKQLQKRLTNILYCQKKQCFSNNSSEIDYKSAKIRAEAAREVAENKRSKVEEIRLKKEQILVQVTLSKIKAEKCRLIIANLELSSLKKNNLRK